eukprot:Clim_evm38s243 gene=Clim_evmTU38s243
MSDPNAQAQEVLAALQRMHGGDVSVQTWLEQVQKSQEAWQVCDIILNTTDVPLDAKVFAAMTMRRKIEDDLVELPKESLPSLRDSLLHIVTQPGNRTEPILIRQLAPAVADLALQFEDWKEPIRPVLGLFNQVQNTSEFLPLIELLLSLPDETGNYKVRVDDERRYEFRDELYRFGNQALDTMNKCFSALSPSQGNSLDEATLAANYRALFRCLAAWVRYECLEIVQLAESPILSFTFEAVSLPMLTDAACEAISAILYVCDDRQQYDPLMAKIVPAVMSLRQNLAKAINEEDTETILHLAVVFCDLGESFVDMIIDQASEAWLEIVEVILVCTKYGDYEISEVCLGFWYQLANGIDANRPAVIPTFRPYFEQLVLTLADLVQLPEDVEKILSKNDEAVYRREKAAEILEDCVLMVDVEPCIQLLLNNFQGVSNGHAGGLTAGNVHWKLVESRLFCISWIITMIDADQSRMARDVFATAVSFAKDGNHPCLRATSLQLLGRLDDWLRTHSEFVGEFLQICIMTVQVKDLQHYSCRALRRVLLSSRANVVQHLNTVKHFLTAAEQSHVSPAEYNDALEGTMAVILHMPPEQMQVALNDLCRPFISDLVQLLQWSSQVDNDQRIKSREKTRLENVLYSLSHIFRSVEIPPAQQRSHEKNPMVALAEELYPYFEKTAELYTNETRMTENLCRCIRYLIKNLGILAQNFFMPLVDFLAKAYHASGQSAYLYVACTLMDVLGPYGDTFRQPLLDMHRLMCQQVFGKLQSLEDFTNSPHVVEDFFRLQCKMLKWYPVDFMTSDLFALVMQLAYHGVCMDHREANGSVCELYSKVLSEGLNNDGGASSITFGVTTDFLKQYDYSLIRRFLAVAFDLPRYVLVDIAELLWLIHQIIERRFDAILQRILEEIDNLVVSERVKHQFFTSMRESHTEKQIRSSFWIIRDYVRYRSVVIPFD